MLSRQTVANSTRALADLIRSMHRRSRWTRLDLASQMSRVALWNRAHAKVPPRSKGPPQSAQASEQAGRQPFISGPTSSHDPSAPHRRFEGSNRCDTPNVTLNCGSSDSAFRSCANATWERCLVVHARAQRRKNPTHAAPHEMYVPRGVLRGRSARRPHRHLPSLVACMRRRRTTERAQRRRCVHGLSPQPRFGLNDEPDHDPWQPCARSQPDRECSRSTSVRHGPARTAYIKSGSSFSNAVNMDSAVRDTPIIYAPCQRMSAQSSRHNREARLGHMRHGRVTCMHHVHDHEVVVLLQSSMQEVRSGQRKDGASS
jgi:hypothetical protein